MSPGREGFVILLLIFRSVDVARPILRHRESSHFHRELPDNDVIVRALLGAGGGLDLPLGGILPLIVGEDVVQRLGHLGGIYSRRAGKLLVLGCIEDNVRKRILIENLMMSLEAEKARFEQSWKGQFRMRTACTG